ncbi:MAG: hypothetical protein HYT27_00930 [Parcubacteria group bacterium]|nr:hypothetical protein [Parcubacteria group bacterium]
MMVAALGAYLVFYIFFPVISPWPGTIAAFAFGSSVVILTAVTHPLPFLDSGSVIDFNLSRGLSILLAYLLFVSIGSVFAIFVRLFLQAKSYEVRIVSFLMSILALMGIVNAFFRYLLPRSTASNFLQIRTFDVTHVVIGLVFIVVFLLPPIIIKQISRTRNRQT